MADVSKTEYRALLIQDPRLTYDDAFDKTTTPTTATIPLTQAGPHPGIPEAQQETDLVLESGGVQAAARTLAIRANRAGHPRPDGGAFVHRYTDATGALQWKGWDPPNVIHDFSWIDWGGGIQNRPDILRRQDDGLVVVMQRGTSNIRCWRRSFDAEADSSTWSESAVASGTWADEACPTVLQLPNGRLLCFHFLELSGSVAQVSMLYSDDLGATWTEGQESALLDSIDMTTMTLRGLRARYLNGQILMLAWLTDTSVAPDQDVLVQYASNDLGASFMLVSQTSNTTSRGFPNIAVVGGTFVCAYLVSHTDELTAGTAGAGDIVPFVVILGSAFQSFTAAEAIPGHQSSNPMEWGVRSGGTGYFTSGDLALCVDEDGILYMLGRDHDTGGGAFMECYTQRSLDNGYTWAMTGSGAAVGLGAAWWRGNDTGVYPFDFAVAAQEGRLVVVGTFESDTADALGNEDDESLFAIMLGGYTNVCLPNLAGSMAQVSAKNRVAWEWTWLPFAFPEAYNGWTLGTAGAPVIGASAFGDMSYSGGAGAEAAWDRTATPSGTIQEGLLVLVDCMSVNTDDAGGGFYLRVDVGDGANRCAARIRVTQTDLYLTDLIGAGTQFQVTTALGSGFQLLLSFTKPAAGATDAEVRAWYSTGETDGSAQAWTAIGSASNYGSDVSIITHNVRFGYVQTVGGTTTGRIKMVSFSHDSYTGAQLYDFVNPDNLLGRTYSAGYQFVDGGTRIKAVDGPAFTGDTHNISTRYDYGAENVHPEVSPSPRREWRSTSDSAAQNLVWDVNAALGEESYLLGKSLGLYLGSINFKTATLYGYNTDTAAWDTIAAIDTSTGQTGLSFARRGDLLEPNATVAGTPSTTWYTYETLAASYVKLHSDAVGEQVPEKNVIRKILHNSEGAWRQDLGTTKVARLILEGVAATDPTGAEAGAVAEIYGKDVLVVVHDADRFSRFRLSIPVQETYENYFKIGVRVLGHIAYFARQYSHGRVIENETNTELTEGRSGSRRSRNLGPMRRAIQVAWTDGVVTSDLSVSTPTPDYVAAYTSGVPVAAPADTAWLIRGIHEMTGGADVPVVYCAKLSRTASASTDLVLLHRDTFLYGRLVGAPRLENIVGDEWMSPDGEVFQVATITIEEEV